MEPTDLDIKFSRLELEYLVSSGFLSSDQSDVIRCAAKASDGSATVTISRNRAEEFRETFTYQLAKIGFDKNYEVTAEGKMLEGLIDRFFAR